MEHSLIPTFEQAARRIYNEYPYELRQLAVLLVPDQDKPVFLSPQVADELTRDTALIKECLAEWAALLKKHNASGVSLKQTNLAGTPVSLVVVGETPADLFTDKYTKEMEIFHTFFHEIAHLLLRNGSDKMDGVSENMAESACDAFAMLMHIQMFGKDTDDAGHHAERTAAFTVVFSRAQAYTSPSVRRAIEMANEAGDTFFDLSVQEIAEMAAQAADDACLDDDTLARINAAYLPAVEMSRPHIKGAWDYCRNLSTEEKKPWRKIFRKIIGIMQDNRHDPEIFNAGKQFLHNPYIKDLLIKNAARETGVYWKEALDLVDIHRPEIPAHLSALHP